MPRNPGLLGGDTRGRAASRPPDGQCHREETARAVTARARVKRCGKSAPREAQATRHGKPHRVQGQIGDPGAARSRAGQPAGSRVWLLRQMILSPGVLRGRQNSAYSPPKTNSHRGRSSSCRALASGPSRPWLPRCPDVRWSEYSPSQRSRIEPLNLEQAVPTTKHTKGHEPLAAPRRPPLTRQVNICAAAPAAFRPGLVCGSCLSWFPNCRFRVEPRRSPSPRCERGRGGRHAGSGEVQGRRSPNAGSPARHARAEVPGSAC